MDARVRVAIKALKIISWPKPVGTLNVVVGLAMVLNEARGSTADSKHIGRERTISAEQPSTRRPTMGSLYRSRGTRPLVDDGECARGMEQNLWSRTAIITE